MCLHLVTQGSLSVRMGDDHYGAPCSPTLVFIWLSPLFRLPNQNRYNRPARQALLASTLPSLPVLALSYGDTWVVRLHSLVLVVRCISVFSVRMGVCGPQRGAWRDARESVKNSIQACISRKATTAKSKGSRRPSLTQSGRGAHDPPRGGTTL